MCVQINHQPKGICPSCGKCRDCGSTGNPKPAPRGYGLPNSPWTTPNGFGPAKMTGGLKATYLNQQAMN